MSTETTTPFRDVEMKKWDAAPELQVEQSRANGRNQLFNSCLSQVAAEEIQIQHLGEGSG